MAVALATLPSNSRLAGGGGTFFAAATGADLAGDFAADFIGPLAGFAAEALLAAGFATGCADGFSAAVRGALLCSGADFFGTALDAEDLLATTFSADAFFGAATFLGVAAFLATAAFFGAAFFATTFLATSFFAAGFLAAATFLPNGFATALDTADFFLDFTSVAGFGVFLAGVLTTVRPAFAGVLLGFFTTSFPFAAVVFDAAASTPLALFEALSFCALALELPVVFAISLHRGWPWRPGVIAHVSFTSKPDSRIPVTLHPPNRSSSVNLLTRLILWLLRFYKRWISPLLGPRCRFHPSCSDYARIAVVRFGPWRGSLLAGWRILRCQPLCTGGPDPVPEHFHYRRCHCKEDGSEVE